MDRLGTVWELCVTFYPHPESQAKMAHEVGRPVLSRPLVATHLSGRRPDPFSWSDLGIYSFPLQYLLSLSRTSAF